MPEVIRLSWSRPLSISVPAVATTVHGSVSVRGSIRPVAEPDDPGREQHGDADEAAEADRLAGAEPAPHGTYVLDGGGPGARVR